MKPGRNAPCPCGSGKKYKKCCMEKGGAAVVESTEFIWRKLRKTEGDLTALLINFAMERFGEDALQTAWDEFLLWSGVELAENELMDMDSVFGIWFAFTWDAWDLLEEMEGGHEALEADFLTVAMLYLKEKPDNLDAFQRRYVQEMTDQPYSFCQVIDVKPGKSLTLRDLFLNQTHVVIEKKASLPEMKGNILFTRVVSLDGVSVMVGCMPFVMATHYHSFFIDLRIRLEKENGGQLSRETLLENDFEMREIFFEIFKTFQKKTLPELQNTDGEPFIPVKRIYHLECAPQEAFDALKSLAVGMDAEDLLADARHDKKGALSSIRFPWLKKGNKKHSGWENTVMGQIEIHHNRLTVEVNSVNRAEIIEKEIKKRLGENAVYKRSAISSIQKMMENGIKGGQAAKAKDGELSQEELMQLPEVKAKIAEMAKRHWATWADTPVPALGDMTPRQAAKDPIGREKLEGLFLHYEAMSRKQDKNEFSPDIDKLKKILGI